METNESAKKTAPIPKWRCTEPMLISIEMRPKYQNDSGPFNGNGGSRAASGAGGRWIHVHVHVRGWARGTSPASSSAGAGA